jgi:hypothetical protein
LLFSPPNREVEPIATGSADWTRMCAFMGGYSEIEPTLDTPPHFPRALRYVSYWYTPCRDLAVMRVTGHNILKMNSYF